MGHLGVRPPSWGSSFFNFMPTKARVYNRVWAEFAVNNYFPKKVEPEIDNAPLFPHEYAKLQELLGTIKIEGKGIYDAMLDTANSFTEYHTRGPDRAIFLNAQREKYLDEAKRLVLELHPEIVERIRDVELEKNASSYEQQPFEELVPEKSFQDFLQRGPN